MNICVCLFVFGIFHPCQDKMWGITERRNNAELIIGIIAGEEKFGHGHLAENLLTVLPLPR